MMRHLVEVMLVLDGKQSWARALRDRRSEQGLVLPLPSMSFDDDDDDDDDGSRGMLRRVLRVMVEGPIDKELMRVIVSFI